MTGTLLRTTLVLALLTACARPDGQEPTLDDVVAQAGRFPLPAESPETVTTCDGDGCPAPTQEGDSLCTYGRIRASRHLESCIALQPNAAALWPGNVVQGRDAAEGLLSPLGLPLAPVTFSVSLDGLPRSSARMEIPSASIFRDALRDLLGAGTGTGAADVSLEVSEVRSTRDLTFKLGTGDDWPGARLLKGAFDFSSNSRRSRVLVDFTQAYFTVDADLPTRPSDHFAPSVTTEELQASVGLGNPPLAVRSVTYGRRVLFALESDASTEELGAAVKALRAMVQGRGQLRDPDRRTLEAATTRAFVLGGSGELAATGILGGLEGILELIRAGGTYSRESPGAPLAYTLAYLDGAPVTLALTIDAVSRTCVRNRGGLEVGLAAIAHLAGADTGEASVIELRGTLRALVPTPEAPVRIEGGRCAGGEAVPLLDLPSPETDPLESEDPDADDYVGRPFLAVPENGTLVPDPPRDGFVAVAALGGDSRLCLVADLWEARSEDDDLLFGFGRQDRDVALSPASMVVALVDGFDTAPRLFVEGPGGLTLRLDFTLGLR